MPSNSDSAIRPAGPSTHALAPVAAGPLEQNPAAVYLAHLQPTGRRTMRQALDVIAGLLTGAQANALTCPWSALRFQHTMAVRARLAAEYQPATANKMLSALRGTLKMAWRLGQMSADEYGRAADLPAVRGQTLPAGREIAQDELGALLQACAADHTPAGVRDAALIGLLYTAGLRREEAASLEVGHYEVATGQLVVRGKGRKERTTYVLGTAATALATWLAVRGGDAGALFCPITKTGKLLRRALTAQAIYNMLQKRARLAGVAACSPHDLRRTFVSDLLDAGADIVIVAQLAGHAHVQTTARYDRRPEAAKKRAASLLTLPSLHPAEAE